MKVKRGMIMQNGWDRQPRTKCYKENNTTLMIVGAVLIALGLLLLFLCIPGWAWAAFTGILLIGAGYLLIRLGKTGR